MCVFVCVLQSPTQEQCSSQTLSDTKLPSLYETRPREWWSCVLRLLCLKYETKISSLRAAQGMIFHRRLTQRLLLNIFSSSSSRSSGIYAILNKVQNDGPLSRAITGAKRHFFCLRLRTSLILLRGSSTFFRWAFQSCPANPCFGQTDTVA